MNKILKESNCSHQFGEIFFPTRKNGKNGEPRRSCSVCGRHWCWSSCKTEEEKRQLKGGRFDKERIVAAELEKIAADALEKETEARARMQRARTAVEMARAHSKPKKNLKSSEDARRKWISPYLRDSIRAVQEVFDEEWSEHFPGIPIPRRFNSRELKQAGVLVNEFGGLCRGAKSCDEICTCSGSKNREHPGLSSAFSIVGDAFHFWVNRAKLCYVSKHEYYPFPTIGWICDGRDTFHAYIYHAMSDVKHYLEDFLEEFESPVGIPVGNRVLGKKECQSTTVSPRPFEVGRIHKTEAGHMVRSKSELIIADKLHSRVKSYVYEQPIRIDGEQICPDFRIESHGKVFYWEHLGMMNKQEYRDRWAHKLALYRSGGVFPVAEGGGPNGTLITTEEDGSCGLDSSRIRQIIDETILGKKDQK